VFPATFVEVIKNSAFYLINFLKAVLLNEEGRGKLKITDDIDTKVRISFIRKLKDPKRVYEDLDTVASKKEPGMQPLRIKKYKIWKMAA